MAVIEEASDLPLLRPLLAFDKAEIVAEAKEIGTLDVAILPAEDCCTLFSSPVAETRAELERLRALEARIEVADTVETLLGSAEVVYPRYEPEREGSLVG